MSQHLSTSDNMMIMTITVVTTVLTIIIIIYPVCHTPLKECVCMSHTVVAMAIAVTVLCVLCQERALSETCRHEYK